MNAGTKGKLALLATASLWSTSGLFIKIIDWHPVLIAGARSSIAVLFMAGFRLIIKRERPRAFAASFAKAARTLPFWLSGAAYSATMLLFVAANKHTTSANAILLQYSAPVWTAFLGWIIIKEKPRAEHWGGMLCVIAGLVIFFRHALGEGGLFGDILAVLSGVAFGANSVFLRMQKDGNPSCGMFLANSFTALAAIPFLPLLPDIAALGTAPVLAVIYMGLLQIGLASLLFAYGLTQTPAIAAMLIVAVEPILNPLWVFIATGERPSHDAFIGGGVIVAAVIAVNLISARRVRGRPA
ncbi:MAG: DMT family transporter [Spirochaetaceae bacterium]|jgi:drug/metabolite transporter (DMT)-like permease|nr:DMT family transporter [Spirochaetaceae bacterium]